YLGNEITLSNFVTFMHGYDANSLLHGKNDTLLSNEFKEFVTMKYIGKTETPMGWFSLILEKEPDEYKAFLQFWELLDEYLISLDYEPIPKPEEPQRRNFHHTDGINTVYYVDLPELAESYMRTFNGEPWFDRWTKEIALQRLRQLYKTSGFHGLAVWEDDSPLGAVFGREEYYYGGNCFQIVELWVEPKAQRMGWGGKLLDELKEMLCENVRKIYLITMADDNILKFYEKNHFIVQKGMCLLQLPEIQEDA
ncbi:MAG TPA: hypothetical protein DCO72_03760, partial [Ruminococcus sp.]|nr:hypothetical protein [Ruminococcus sp.]